MGKPKIEINQLMMFWTGSFFIVGGRGVLPPS